MGGGAYLPALLRVDVGEGAGEHRELYAEFGLAVVL